MGKALKLVFILAQILVASTQSGNVSATVFVQSAQNHFTSVGTSFEVGNGVGSGWSTGNVTSGDTLIVTGNYTGSTTFTATDSLSTTLTCVRQTTGLTVGNFFTCIGVATASGSDVITITSAANIIPYLVAFEFSGLATGAIDQKASANVAACTSCTLPSITTTKGNGATIGCGGTDSNNATFTAGSGFTLPANGKVSASGQAIGCEYQVTSNTATQTPTINIGSSTAISGFTFNIY